MEFPLSVLEKGNLDGVKCLRKPHNMRLGSKRNPSHYIPPTFFKSSNHVFRSSIFWFYGPCCPAWPWPYNARELSRITIFRRFWATSVEYLPFSFFLFTPRSRCTTSGTLQLLLRTDSSDAIIRHSNCHLEIFQRLLLDLEDFLHLLMLAKSRLCMHACKQCVAAGAPHL